MGSEAWLCALMMVLGYLMGSLPFGIIVSRALGAPDPRTGGSRNIGFTNVLRVSGKKAAVLTLLGDAGKGWIVSWVAGHVLQSEAFILMVAVTPVVGHMYSVVLGLKGGKGVATALGALLGVAAPVGVASVGLWLAGLVMSRISSVGALIAFVGLPVIVMAGHGSWAMMAFACVLSGLVLLRHGQNIVRLIGGREPRIGESGR